MAFSFGWIIHVLVSCNLLCLTWSLFISSFSQSVFVKASQHFYQIIKPRNAKPTCLFLRRVVTSYHNSLSLYEVVVPPLEEHHINNQCDNMHYQSTEQKNNGLPSNLLVINATMASCKRTIPYCKNITIIPMEQAAIAVVVNKAQSESNLKEEKKVQTTQP